MKTKGKSLLAIACVAAYAAAACAQEDWGGPKGPPPPPAAQATAFHAAPAEGTMTDLTPHGHAPHGHGGSAAPGNGTAEKEGAGPAEGAAGDAGSGGGVPRVEAEVTAGKIAGFDDAVAGLRAAMKACVAGKGPEGAVVELTAQIGPKGTVVRSDHVGGSEFAQGAVPCLERLVEGAQFKKPDLDAGPPPRVTFRVKMAHE